MKLSTIGVAIGVLVASVWFAVIMSHKIIPQPLAPIDPLPVDDATAVRSAPSRNPNPAPADSNSSQSQEQPSVDDDSQPNPDVTEKVDDTSPKRQVSQGMIIAGDEQYPNKQYQALASSDDPNSDQPWEQTIRLDDARAVTGSYDYTPTVAVIDSGFALEHEDLVDKWATNSAETGATSSQDPSRLNCSDQSLPLDQSCNNIDDDFNGIVDDEAGATSTEHASSLNCTDQGLSLDKSCNLIDDDGNGLVDDHIGYDFINYNGNVQAGQTSPTSDSASHGTLVSGIIGATNNNQLGIAGTADNVKLLPLQALSDDGIGFTVSVADAIIYATQRQVDVINLSLGGTSTDSYLRQAIDYATRHGVVVVAASGNDGCACINYPAALSSVVAVGALDTNLQPATFSNWGQALDVVAPGVNLLTTSWTASNQVDSYGQASGTSLSTPVVSGVIARLISQQPELTPIQTKALLGQTANRLGLASDQPRSNQLGFGMSDALTATNRAVSGLTTAQVTQFSDIRSGQNYQSNWPQLEQGPQHTVYNCDQTANPTTPVYELTKNNDLLFTVSQVERDRAIDAGYEVSLAFYGCVLQPHDQPSVKRTINIYQEFYNRQRKG